MIDGQNFIAIDFETATGKRASICEIGICVVRNGEISETRSWLVQPEDNLYSYWNMQCHGITPEDTENSPSFPEVWEEIERLFLDDFDTLVAHNATFDRSCLEHSAQLYNLHLPELQWQCTLKIARQRLQYTRLSLRTTWHPRRYSPSRRRRCRDVCKIVSERNGKFLE